ncbi:MAG: hypothetical protein QOE66_1407, partial [Chloroflexota bacterium]|nr:hypothetical protein [Chloroflexota bacterium]
MQTRRWIFAGWLIAGSALVAAPALLTAQVVPPPPPVVPTAPVPPAPAMPSTTATEVPVVPTPPSAPEPAAAEPAAEEPSAPAGPTFEFGLRGEDKCISPYTHGDAKTEEGKIDVVPEKNTLTVTLTGGVGANVFLGAHSEAMQSFRLLQEFEVTCSD